MKYRFSAHLEIDVDSVVIAAVLFDECMSRLRMAVTDCEERGNSISLRKATGKLVSIGERKLISNYQHDMSPRKTVKTIKRG